MNLFFLGLGVLIIIFAFFIFTIMLCAFCLIVAGATQELSRLQKIEELNAAESQKLKNFLINQNKAQTNLWSRKKEKGTSFGK